MLKIVKGWFLCDLQETTALMLAASEAETAPGFQLSIANAHPSFCQGHPDVLKAGLSEGFLSALQEFSESTHMFNSKI